MSAPVELQLSLADLEELHHRVAREGARLPPHSVRVPGSLLARLLGDHGALYRRLSLLGIVAEPGEVTEAA